MTGPVSWRRADPRDELLLKGFTCCRHLPAYGTKRSICTRPYAHSIQTYVRLEALGQQQAYAHLDYRLMLLFDGPDLVGIAAHENCRVSEGRAARFVECIAVASDVQGKALSDGVAASRALTSRLLMDIRGCSPVPQVVVSEVHQDNVRSQGLLRRLGCTFATSATLNAVEMTL